MEGSAYSRPAEAPPLVKLKQGLRMSRFKQLDRLIRELPGIHNRNGAKRGSARGKPLEKPRTRTQALGRSKTKVLEGSRSTLQFVKSERDGKA